MVKEYSRRLSFILKSIGEVFSVFFSLGKGARRTKVFYLVSFLPVLIALVIKSVQLFTEVGSLEGIYIFSSIIMAFYLQFLILILALFFGTSICSEELEAKTLTYLTTRPISKSAIFLGKFAAYGLLVILMMLVGMILCFFILNFDSILNFSLYPILVRDMGVLSLGLVCYMSLFAFGGTFLKKSIIFGLIFSFGWESVIQYFPGSTQRFAIAHYLKSLLPSSTGGEFSILLFRLESTTPGLAVGILFSITAIFLALGCLVFSQKEYIFED